MTPPRYTGTGPCRGLSCFLSFLLLVVSLPWVVTAEPADDLTVGEAFYMSGNLEAAQQRLSRAAGSRVAVQSQRALYLLGRISLLTGDFRQAKEYFERSADIDGAGTTVRWMALAGIGDTFYASGRYEDAIRRYRLAQGGSGNSQERAVIALKIALCEHSLGRESMALDNLRAALRQIPVLSGWVGREEEFYHTMVMVGIEPPGADVTKIFIIAGPIKGDFRADEIVGSHVRAGEVRKKGGTFIEFGPLTDSVEAMILSEKIRNRFSVPVEIVTR